MPHLIPQEQLRRTLRIYSMCSPALSIISDLFYERLLVEDSSCRHIVMHTRNRERQFRLFLSIVIHTFMQPEYDAAILTRMGARHHHHGIQQSQYEACERAFLWTLNEGMSDLLNQEDCRSLLAVTQFVSQQLQQGHPSPMLHVVNDHV